MYGSQIHGFTPVATTYRPFRTIALNRTNKSQARPNINLATPANLSAQLPARFQFKKKRQLAQNQLANIESIFLFRQNHDSDFEIQIAGQNRFEADGGAPLIKIDDQASKKTQGLNERRFLSNY